MANIRKVITKRAHKLIDYDRHRDSVKKLKDRTDRTHGDEKKLGQLEAALDQATRDYQNINNTLMREIPILLSLRISFADPCFRTLFWYQLKVFQALQVTFSKLTRSTFKTPLSAKDGYLLKEIELLQMLSELSLVKRPFKSSDGTEIRGAFYDENDNNLTLSSSNEKYPPSSAASPPSYGQLSPTSPSSASRHQQQLNQAEHFPDMHKQFSPSPIGSTGILSSHASPAADGSVRRQFCVALYDFTGETNDDLSFYRDDRIEIVKKTESANDWWTGKLRGKVGSFPGNYVTALED